MLSLPANDVSTRQQECTSTAAGGMRKLSPRRTLRRSGSQTTTPGSNSIQRHDRFTIKASRLSIGVGAGCVDTGAFGMLNVT
jgi:hypothetical protein